MPDHAKQTDPTTQSNYWQIRTEHATLDWSINFDNKSILYHFDLSGSITHSLKALDPDGVKEAIFDTVDITVSTVEVDGKTVNFELKPTHPVMGSALHVPLGTTAAAGTTLQVKIHYATSPECSALQWLEKEQTKGGTHPYLFSQCQPIYARSMAPLQDTPSSKFTYSSNVTSTLPVLMSAVRRSPPANGPPHDGKVIGKDLVTYTYNQPVPIQSYLIAIACGNLVYKPFATPKGKSWSCGVWSEPELIDDAFWEFSEDTPKFLAKEEEIVVPYKFGVYDLLVLPPSFPYGGMENACLSFLTPTLLSGDRALVDVVVHELTHSWFGNGVTHTDATHFWLNEGWTTYIERVLQEVLHSPADRGFSYLIGYKSLQNSLKQFEDRPRYQSMVIYFEKGEDPDDAYSTVPYEKGANLLLHLERILGGLEVFLPYVRDYVNTYIGKSINTETWKNHLYDFWRKHGGEEKIRVLDTVDWDKWFYGQGMELPVKLEYDESLAAEAYKLAERWNESRSKAVTNLDFNLDDLKDFNTNQQIAFLEKLQSYDALPISHVQHLGKVYQLDSTNNVEVRWRYYEAALLNPKNDGVHPLAVEAAHWIVGADGSGIIKGRMKFCRPTFRAVRDVDVKLAREVFTKHKTAFHPIARRLIEKDLGLV